MKHFIFDCDDVLLNWQKGFAGYMRARGFDLCIKGHAECCVSHWIGCTPNEAKRWIEQFNASPAFSSLEAMDGAYDALWYVADEGYTIDILTACGDLATTRLLRQDNLDRLFSIGAIGKIRPFDEIKFLPLGASKGSVLVNYAMSMPIEDLVLVEDNYQHAAAGARVGIRSFCLRRNHNRANQAQGEGSGVIWIDNLSELLDAM